MRRKRQNKILNLFFDFYALNDLYLRVGGFRDIGYKTYDVFVSEKIFERIKEKYEEKVDLLFNLTKECLARTTRGELINNFYGYTYLPDDEKINDKDNPDRSYWRMTREILMRREGYNLDIFRNEGIVKNAKKAYKLFSEYTWEESYGGTAWAQAALALDESVNVKTYSDKVYWIDKVMDLQHNNGHILNKTEFRCVSDYMDGSYGTYLDYRANCPSIINFIDYCSYSVAKLVIPRKKLLITT